MHCTIHLFWNAIQGTPPAPLCSVQQLLCFLQSMIELSRTQDEEVGHGTTQVTMAAVSL